MTRPAPPERDVSGMLRGAAASASSTSAAGILTRVPSTRAPAFASSASAPSCCTSTPVCSRMIECRGVQSGAPFVVKGGGAQPVVSH